MKPTRIIEPPHALPKHDQRARGVANKMIFVCDDGKEYTLIELSQIAGFKTGHGIWQRLKRYGWDHPAILTLPRGKTGKIIEGLPVGNINYSNEQWQKLSSKPRNRNLAKICKPGTLERKYLSRNGR